MLQAEDLELLVHESSEALANLIVQRDNEGLGLLPLNVRQKKMQQELEDKAKTIEKKVEDGLKACILALSQCSDLPMTVEKLKKELQKSVQSIKSTKELTELGGSVFLGTSWKNKLGLSDDCLQTLYQGARALYEKKEYDQAEKSFFAICTLDPTQFAYWIGLGHSSFQMKNYAQAINAYSMASALDSENVLPHIFAANCFEEVKDLNHAKMALEEALSLLGSKTPKDQDLIHSLQERVKKNQ